jgi:hypothetical protein
VHDAPKQHPRVLHQKERSPPHIDRPRSGDMVGSNAQRSNARGHALKCSAVKSPDGLIFQLYGPFEGRRNDNLLFSLR